MTHRLFTHAALVLALTCLAPPLPVRGQDQQRQTEPKPAATLPKTVGGENAGTLLSAPPSLPSARPKPFDVNVKVDVTITDDAGSGPPIVKTLSIVLADQHNGSIRTEVSKPTPFKREDGKLVWPTTSLPLAIDVLPTVKSLERVQVNVKLNYRTATEGARKDEGEPQWNATVTKEINTILDSGKPMVVSQSADAATNRNVKVELKATILK